jgi:hypothetical protein
LIILNELFNCIMFNNPIESSIASYLKNHYINQRNKINLITFANHLDESNEVLLEFSNLSFILQFFEYFFKG